MGLSHANAAVLLQKNYRFWLSEKEREAADGAADAAAAGASSAHDGSSEDAPAASEWEELIDSRTGGRYFRNKKTQKTQWQPPPGARAHTRVSYTHTHTHTHTHIHTAIAPSFHLTGLLLLACRLHGAGARVPHA